MENNELQHWGTKGMKWGVRRYQNKDGTLTPAGKKRYAEEMNRLKKEEQILKNKQRTKAQLDKLSAKEQEIKTMKKAAKSKTPAKPEVEKPAANIHESIGKKKVKDMTDDELRALTNRMQLEKNYRDAMRELTPKVEKGKKFTDQLKENAKAGIAEGGKELTKKAVTGAGGMIAKAIKDAMDESKKNR